MRGVSVRRAWCVRATCVRRAWCVRGVSVRGVCVVVRRAWCVLGVCVVCGESECTAYYVCTEEAPFDCISNSMNHVIKGRAVDFKTTQVSGL